MLLGLHLHVQVSCMFEIVQFGNILMGECGEEGGGRGVVGRLGRGWGVTTRFQNCNFYADWQQLYLQLD